MKDNVVQLSCHLVVAAHKFSKRGNGDWYHYGSANVRVAKNKPALSKDEIAIALKLDLPIALFQRPDLTAEIVVPAEKAPFVITPDVQHQIAEHIREQTGFTVRIEASAPEEER